MTAESEIRSRERRLVGGALIFQRVERFVRRHPELRRDEVAELAKLTMEFILAEPANRQGIRKRLNTSIRTLVEKSRG